MSCTVRIVTGRLGAALPVLLSEAGALYRAGERVLVLVPETYTLQMEQELIDSLRLPGFLDMEVLSPSRLKRRVEETAGGTQLPSLDRRGAAMAMGQVLTERREDLRYYSRVARKPSLPGRILEEIGDFRNAGLTPETLALPEESASPAARAKLADLSLCWTAYEKLIEGRFADSEAQQRETALRIPESGLIRGAHILVYGFDLLNRGLCVILAQCALVAASVTVTLTEDDEAADRSVFQNQTASLERLRRMLAERGLTSRTERAPVPGTDRNPAIAHLERTLFADRAAAFEGDASCVELHTAPNPVAEAKWCAALLRGWHEAGIPWQRMGVVLATAPAAALGQTLRDAGIPFYLSRKSSVARHPLCRMLLASLRAVTEGWQAEDVLEAARSGFSLLTEEEAMRLENYALAHGIRRKKWLAPFTRGEDAEAMEDLRARLIGPMQTLREQLRAARTTDASLTAVWDYLEACDCYNRLQAAEARLLAQGMDAEAAQNRQVWRVTLGLLDQLHALLDGKRAALQDIVRFVATGLEGAAVSALPPRSDAVMIGEIGPFTARGLDALAVLGMLDGAMTVADSGLITEQERAELSREAGQPVGQTVSEKAAMRSFDFYRILSMPSRFLSLSWSGGALDGTAQRPASLLADIEAALPHCRKTGGSVSERDEIPLSPASALEGAALRLRELLDTGRPVPDNWIEAMRALAADPQTAPRLRNLFALLDNKVPERRLTREEAARLFLPASQSISRLEAFADCPFRHFVAYGLRPAEREAFTYRADERGTFYHEALRSYLAIVKDLPSWPNLTDEEIDDAVDKAVAPLIEAWQGGPLEDDAIGRLEGRSYVRAARFTMHTITKHAARGAFRVVGTEEEFGRGEEGLPPLMLETEDGHPVALHGVIDRLDMLDGADRRYVRVVDYKSGDRSLDGTLMDEGIQLQLPLYLAAAAQGMHAEPGGAMYLRVYEPKVDAPDDPAEVEKQLEGKTLFKGIMLENSEVEAASLGAGYGALTRTGKISKSGMSCLTEDEMKERLDKSRRKAAELSSRIRSGEIEAAPARKGEGHNACTYCAYAAVCGRDEQSPAWHPRELG